MTTAQSAKTPDPRLRGYLVIYVDGYKRALKNRAHVFFEDGYVVTVPDHLLPPPSNDVGSNAWWEDGWAVGDNQRDILCLRAGAKPLRRFYYYDEAVSFVFHRQKKYKSHQHILVYATKELGGKEQLEVVRSLDDINAVEARVAAEIAENDVLLAERRAKFELQYPHLKVLQEQFNGSMALTLSILIQELRDEGYEAVKATRPKATLSRQIKRLRELGLLTL